jgi:hypothetical protein
MRLSLTSSMAKEKVRSAPATRLAATNGTVTRRSVPRGRPPRLALASSSATLVCRKPA